MGTPTIKSSGEGERRWFYGGGVHTWKVTEGDSDGSISSFEDVMAQGKNTPWHRHPNSDELVYLVEGECLVNLDGHEQTVRSGGMWFVPRGTEHAFTVLSPTARILSVMTPGSAGRFYWEASEPAGDVDGKVDFAVIGQVAKSTGVTDVLGPPPFGD